VTRLVGITPVLSDVSSPETHLEFEDEGVEANVCSLQRYHTNYYHKQLYYYFPPYSQPIICTIEPSATHGS